ncbi:MAG: CotH kinase family protein [Candidatus Fibromonas sp.]|jgi:hypothetical protein|nr:CotH kinase family protein [Candidatus Fibromonas sp.]
MKGMNFKTALAIVACSSVLSLAALPEIKVTTKNNAAINSSTASRQGAGNCQSTNTYSHKYTGMSVTITGHTFTGTADSIRGRGNSTWGQPKKPYRIKFGEKQSIFGLQKNKSWALLANYYDPTFALNAVGFELGKRLGLPGTPNHFLVDFYLNNEYKGIYQITDLVQVNKGRVDIDEKEGWLVEFDYHCPSDADEIDFNTDYPSNAKLHSFIKSPEDLPNTAAYQFVKDQVNQLTTTMFNKSGFPENGYRDLVDLESVVKYVMIQQFIDNFDFNNKAGDASIGTAPGSNFFHKDKGKKIVAGSLWDMDLAAGVEKNNFPKHYQKTDNPVKPKHPFYAKFFDDPVFLAKWKKAWDKYKSDFQNMTKVMDSIATHVEGSVVKNFALQTGSGGNPWGGGGGCFMMCPDAPATVQAYKDEVGKLKTWWNSRINNFSQQITAMNIDTSKDIEESRPSSSSSRPSSSSSRLSSSSRQSSSSRSITPVIEYSTHKPGMFIRGKNIDIYTQEFSNVKLSVFDLRGKMLFGGSIGEGTHISWNSGHLGTKVFIVVAEASGASGKTYRFTGKILPSGTSQ